METSLERLGRLYGEIQKLGIRVFTFEGISPFGASRFGLADLRGDLLDAMGGVVGQNDFGWWIGQEDMAFNVCMCAHPRKRTAGELEGIQFRLMANRSCLMPDSFTDAMYNVPDWCVRLNAIYEQALPHMKSRRLLPDRAGVRWQDGAIQVVWAIRSVDVSIPAGATVERLLGDRTERIDREGILNADAGNVYRIVSYERERAWGAAANSAPHSPSCSQS
jgi:hypothetical protein